MKKSQLKVLQDTVKSLYDNGIMDETTKQEFQVIFSSSEELPYEPMEVEDLGPGDIKNLRDREHLSKADFALYLNTTIPTIERWERGTKKPTGPELKLLNIVKKKGLRGAAWTIVIF